MHTRRLSRVGLLIVLAVAMALSRPHAQGQETPPPQAPAQAPPTFRGGVDTVSVDITVTDKQGRPVPDLTAEDFEIRESGKPQTIESFRFLRTNDGVDDRSADRDILSMADQQRETASPDNRIIVILFDDYHVRRGNGMVVRQQVSTFIRSLSPRDLVALATPLTTVAGLTFSRSHVSTASSVMSFAGRKYEYLPMNAIEARYQDLPPEQQEQMRNNLTMAALSNISEYMGTLREGRKTLLWVTEGMSGSMPVGVRTTGNFTPNTGTARTSTQTFFENSTLLLDMQTKVFRPAQRNNVAIYTLDPRGLANYEFSVGEDVKAEEDRAILQQTTDLLRVVADQTDGRAIVNRNDPLPALTQMVRDSSAYYLVGYTSTLAPRDGKFHEIQVRLKRPGLEVRARKGYWAYSADDVAAATAPSKPAPSGEVVDALDGLATATDGGRSKAIQVFLGAQRGSDERAVVTFAWEVPQGGSTDMLDAVDRVSVVANAITGEEVFRGLVPRTPGGVRPGGAVTFSAPAGSVRVKITAENAAGLRVDTSDAAVDVPDFTATGPQITTPFIYRGRTARDLQQIRAAIAPVPAITPVFSRTERLLFRFDAYGPAGTTPSVTMRLLNRGGSQIAALPAPVKTTGAGMESELGLSSFPPGDYVVEISASINGESVRRLVALRVTG